MLKVAAVLSSALCRQTQICPIIPHFVIVSTHSPTFCTVGGLAGREKVNTMRESLDWEGSAGVGVNKTITVVQWVWLETKGTRWLWRPIWYFAFDRTRIGVSSVWYPD